VFNPSKSRKRLESTLASLASARGSQAAGIRRYESAGAADLAIQARQAVSDGCRTVIAAGGDGTVLGVLNGLLGSDARLGILPLGTANDYARALGIGRLPDAAAALVRGGTRRVDAGRARYTALDGTLAERSFCLSAGVGFVGRLCQLETGAGMAWLKRWTGDLAFVLAAARLCFTFRGARGQLVLNGQAADSEVTLLEIVKTPTVGGMPITPDATPDDGALHMCLVPRMGPWRRVQLLLSLQFSSRHTGWPDVEYVSTKPHANRFGCHNLQSIAVSTEQPLPVHLNGDYVGTTPLEVEILPGALEVVAPG
jgi:YegS/Rv2252/BmrU family lipid kinase